MGTTSYKRRVQTDGKSSGTVAMTNLLPHPAHPSPLFTLRDTDEHRRPRIGRAEHAWLVVLAWTFSFREIRVNERTNERESGDSDGRKSTRHLQPEQLARTSP